MAVHYASPDSDNYDIVVINDIHLTPRPSPPSTINFDNESNQTGNPQRSQLKVLDDLFGPIKMGPYSITRKALDSLGATFHGQRLDGNNTFFRHAKRSFINSIQLDPLHVEARLRSYSTGDDYRLTSLLFEMASRRPLTAPPLLTDVPASLADSEAYRRKLDKLLKSAQKLDISHHHMPKHTPHWVNRVKSSSMLGVGVGLQAFGIYSGLRGLQDAVARKDEGEIIFNSLSIAGEFASLAVEVAVTKQAKYMINAGQRAYSDFARTSMGVRLARGGGLIAAAVTLPFDIICAVKSFDNAANTAGKEAIDHYVSGGMSVASAAMSLILGVAALAGFSMAGPVGLTAGLLLVAGSQAYAAVRIVDEIDDYIQLSTHERLRTGWFAFWGISPDESIEDRLAIAKATTAHSKMLQASAKELLDGSLKDRIEVIINGTFDVELTPAGVRYYDWDAHQNSHKIIKSPRIIDGNDDLDARYGVPIDTPGASFGTEGTAKGIAWFIGAGNDTVRGVKNKSNSFYFGAGTKVLEGGRKDDEFMFEGAAESLLSPDTQQALNIIKGGDGQDTLVLAGKVEHLHQRHPGYLIDLQLGTLEILTNSGQPGRTHTRLDSIENIETLVAGRNRVVGTDGANTIVSRGDDHVQAGAGDDQISMLNGDGVVNGGPGRDRYLIAHKAGTVVVIEDGIDDSVIALGWRLELIDSWRIVSNTLVITSKFDLDDHLRRTLIIEGVYQMAGAHRQLQNRLLTFITEDGFQLVPDCPETIEDDFPLYVNAVIVQPGKSKQPIIVNTSVMALAAAGNKHYFLPNQQTRTTLNVKHRDNAALSFLYIDFASTDLSSVETHYSMDLTVRLDRDHPTYKTCSLSLNFDDKCITISNLASSHGVGYVLLTDRLTRPPLEMNHQFIIVFNDGVSYHLRPPALADSDIMKMTRFAYVQQTTPKALVQRPGLYDFIQPDENEAHSLGASDKCVNLSAPAVQTAVEVLEGAGSRYLVHLSADMTLRVTTPGAYADASVKSPSASVWEFDATPLGLCDINLVNNALLIGSTTIQLPRYDSPDDLIDPIRVITSQGITYAVDLAFDALYIDSLDGRFFNGQNRANITLINELAAIKQPTISVQNIAMRDGTIGALSYNPSKQRWALDTDTSRLIQFADLLPLNRCAHQLEHCYARVKSQVITEPTLDAAELQLTLDACKLH
jgi:hypothetical protein